MSEIEITIFRSANGPLTKRISIEGGKLKSDASACRMVAGTARRVPLDSPTSLAKLLQNMSSNEAIALGRLRPDLADTVKVVLKKDLTGSTSPKIIARTRDYLEFAPGERAYLLLDHDRKGMPRNVAAKLKNVGGFWKAVTEACPALTGAARVYRRSTSAGLYDKRTGERLKGSANAHVYIEVNDGSDIERAGKTLHNRLWLAGYGYHVVGAVGQLLERSIIDAAVYGPERLVFEGDPIVLSPLAQDADLRRPRAYEGKEIDTAVAIPPLSDKERTQLEALKARGAARLKPEAAKARKIWAHKFAQRRGLSEEEAERIATQATNHILEAEFELEFDDAGTCTVADVLADPDRYVGETLADPLEGIRYGRSKAKVLRQRDGCLMIHSFAHGGINYRLLGPSAGAPILSPRTPLKSAREFVARQFKRDGRSELVHYRSDFYQWLGTHYEELEEDELRSKLYEFLDQALTRSKFGYEPFSPNSHKVNQVLDALAAGVQEKARPNAPFWIGELEHADDPTRLIACRNGLLNLETREQLPHTPHLFNLNCLPFDYDPNAPTYPPQWMKFLRELWPGDDDGRRARFALQEMFGLVLTSDTSYQKIFAIMGPKRSGKGTIGRVLRALLGKDNVAGPTLASISTQFGLEPCINKQAAIISDARLGKNSNMQAIAERLLSISGEDALTIDRKYKAAWTGQLGLRFLILSNELPQIPDAAGAIASRFIILMLTKSFYGKEDLTLTDKLLTELPGILNWALAGLDRLRNRGYFKMPKASLAAIRQLEDLASPVRAFLRDCCDVTDPSAKANVKHLYKAYRYWSEERGMRVKNSIVFGRDLRAVQPQIGSGGRGIGRYYTGIQLSEEGQKQYTEAIEHKSAGKQAIDDDE
jgi:putative DNA primase/helicase